MNFTFQEGLEMNEMSLVSAKLELIKQHLDKVFSGVVLLQLRKRSIIFTNSNRTLFIKSYLGHWTYERASDEFLALQIARRNGLLCPKVYDLHLGEPACWVASEYLNLPTVSPQTGREMASFVTQALEYIDVVHQLVSVERAGHGWISVQQDTAFRDGLDYLVKLIKPNARLTEVIETLEALFEREGKSRYISCSSLHRDLKISHFLKGKGTNNLYLLDWETVSRGPAVTDYVNFLFHILIYSHRMGLSLSQGQLEDYLQSIMDKLPATQQSMFSLVLTWNCTAWASYGNKSRMDWTLPLVRNMLGNLDDPQKLVWFLWVRMNSLPIEAV